ncbi:MAG: hypothetical protein AB9860_08215 [Methanomassiliicoccales archaeon]
MAGSPPSFSVSRWCSCTLPPERSIGTGAARGEVRGYFAQAGLLHIGFNLLMVIPLNFDNIYLAWTGVILATLLVVYYYLQVHRHLLPAVVKDALKAMKKAKG